jgi:tetrahydromethanopterin S-methyltransferase subunit H
MPTTGRTRGVATAVDEAKVVTFNYVAALVTQKFFTAAAPMLVVDITVTPRVAGNDAGVVNLAFFKAASGVAVGSGTPITAAAAANLKGTADVNQVLTLVSDPAALTMQVGDSLGYVLTGTATLAVGCVTVTLEPA